ncbi:MAG TPA: SPOR domain-containing protein [Thermoanaerobaculia bacterium]
MAETHEPSYYEIALTNRQVVVAFAVLLICLLSAFFSGVWIGRESTAREGEEQLVRKAPPPQAPKEGQNLEELDFFDARSKAASAEPGKAPGEDQTPPQTANDTTLLEDLSGEPAAAPTPAPQAEEPAAVRAGADDDAAASQADEDRAERRRNRKKRKAEETAAAAAAAAPSGATKAAPAPASRTPASPAPVAPAVPKGSVVIQVFSSADRDQAERIRDRLAGGGYKVYLSPVERGGRTMYRVRLGPFGSRADAQVVADQVRKGYKLDTWVTE